MQDGDVIWSKWSQMFNCEVLVVLSEPCEHFSSVLTCRSDLMSRLCINSLRFLYSWKDRLMMSALEAAAHLCQCVWSTNSLNSIKLSSLLQTESLSEFELFSFPAHSWSMCNAKVRKDMETRKFILSAACRPDLVFSFRWADRCCRGGALSYSYWIFILFDVVVQCFVSVVCPSQCFIMVFIRSYFSLSVIS